MLDRSCVTINFSHTFATPSTFWYVQGPTSAALQDGENELLGIYKLGYKILKSIIDYSDKELVKDTGKRSAYIIANSKFCASIYQKWGIKITDIIYPPLDCDVFRPRTSSPSSNYVLTYFGKETKFSVIKAVADMGVSIKAFGLKSPIVPRAIFTHPHIEFIGKVTTDKLVNLYSNALFTLFPFTHEPFGYVPVESMACGTPTLTYNTQGPSETIIDGYNGWLAESDETLVSKAQKFWREGYPLRLRSNCIKHALKFDKKFYTQKWLDILHRI
jgi:glycosyltransferase involved in cell wall biosynthesis